jgi:hypothetical protein
MHVVADTSGFLLGSLFLRLSRLSFPLVLLGFVV